MKIFDETITLPDMHKCNICPFQYDGCMCAYLEYINEHKSSYHCDYEKCSIVAIEIHKCN